MGSSGAQRQRRYRAHRRGDHSLCDPARCSGGDGVTVTSVTRDGDDAPRFGARAQRLWAELQAELKPTAGRLALAEEACRIVDRLDRLDALLRGDSDAWLRLRVNEDTTEITVMVGQPLAEARQQAAVLKSIVGELRQGMDGKPASAGVVNVLDQLAAARAKRLAGTAGS